MVYKFLWISRGVLLPTNNPQQLKFNLHDCTDWFPKYYSRTIKMPYKMTDNAPLYTYHCCTDNGYAHLLINRLRHHEQLVQVYQITYKLTELS